MEASMRSRAAVIAGLVLLTQTPALADSSIDVQIVAHVDVFCRVSAPESQEISLQAGKADLGVIDEVCNTPGGYDVRTSFSNVNGGNLQVDGANYAIDNLGDTSRSVTEARAQSLHWRVNGASMVASETPVVMHITIAPH
jgi:hypothetical protein